MQALRSGNLASLPDDSLERYLLEGYARPGVSHASGPLDAYQAGVCVGIAMNRHRVRGLRDEGYAVPEPLFKPDTGPVFGERTVSKMMPAPLRDIIGFLNAIDQQYGRPARFFRDDGTTALLALLPTLLIRNGYSFMGVAHIERGDDDFMSLGLGDALEAFAQHYHADDMASREVLRYRPTQHFRRDKRQKDWHGTAASYAVEGPVQGSIVGVATAAALFCALHVGTSQARRRRAAVPQRVSHNMNDAEINQWTPDER